MDVNVNVQSVQNVAPAAVATPVVNRPIETRPPNIDGYTAQTPPPIETIRRGNESDITNDILDRAVAKLNSALGGAYRLSYGVHEATNRVTVAVYNSEDEIIREIPSEARLDLYARITEFTGLLFDQIS
jgi:uncharacterized FlaG/YvyC family protein